MTSTYIGCTVRQLHPAARVEAARTAVRINPANRPMVHPTLAPMPAEHLALLTSKYWGTKGVRLTVSFMDSPDAETRRKILAAANQWGTRANVSFTQTADVGQVRIARAESGYWSYLGTDILSIPTNQATMNLQGFTANTPDSEYDRVVTHEFGHTLGWPHEHERPEIVAMIDAEKAVNYFMQTQGWSRDEVYQQVLTPLQDIDPNSLPADQRSIMCYELPGSITRSGQPIPGGTHINEEDYQLAAMLYPKSDTGGGGGGSPPPPSPGVGEIAVRGTLPVGWYTLYPAPPRGKHSVLQVIQQVGVGHYSLQTMAMLPGHVPYGDDGDWEERGNWPLQAEDDAAHG